MTEASGASDAGLPTVTLADVLVGQALDADVTDDVVVRLARAAAAHQADEEAVFDLDPASLVPIGRDLEGLLARFRTEVARSALVTQGAKELLADAGDSETALRLVVSDKLARGVLRERHDVDVGELRRLGGAPVGRRPQRRSPAVDRGEHGGLALSELDLGEACARYGVEYRLLRRDDLLLSYRSKGEPRTVSLREFVASLADPAGRPRMNAVCQALLSGQGNRGLLLVLYAASLAGVVVVHRRLEAQFRVFCIRALLAMNAAESAYREASALERDDLLIRFLSEGERRRLLTLVARSAVRSGRVDDGRERYTELYVRDSSDATVFRELLGSAFSLDAEFTRSLCRVAQRGALELRTQDRLFVADLLAGAGEPWEAFALLQQLREEDPSPDVLLGIANVGLALGNRTMWRAAIEQFFGEQQLPVEHTATSDPAPFAFASRLQPATDGAPRVTVVMTTFNAAETVRGSIASVQAQTVTDWELLVVDDQSTDDTRRVLAEIAAADRRVRVKGMPENGGTYLAKNAGIRDASGTFVTFHDSDDWMHPRRLERHLAAMHDQVACSVSRWIRMDEGGLAIIRRGGPYTHVNPASTFFRRAVLRDVGLFDAVRTGADAELVARVRANLGWSAVREIDDCLGIGLHHQRSLTQSGATAFDEFRYSPVRLAYTETWLRWHIVHLADEETVFNAGTRERAYPVPDAIAP